MTESIMTLVMEDESWEVFRNAETGILVGVNDELKLTAQGKDLNDLAIIITEIQNDFKNNG